MVLKRRKSYGVGVANLPATYATNLAIVTGCYCGKNSFFFFFCNSLEFILDILDVILFGPFLLGAFLMGILLIVDFIKCICGNWNDLA